MQVTSELAAMPPYESVIPAQAGISGSNLPTLQIPFDAALRELLETGDWRLETPLAVALSGGADSLACTLLAQEYVTQRGGSIVALTVDHGLRPESRAEAEEVVAWMRARGIEHHILTPEHRPVSRNLQESARIWRYDALAEFCAERGISCCLVAHHAGDNRETLLHQQQRDKMNLLAAGMPRIRLYHDVQFLRPMLRFEREALEHFLRTKNTCWIDDPSNQNETFSRVRNRKMLQQNAAQNSALDATLKANTQARATRDRALAEAAATCITLHPLGFAQINLPLLQQNEASLASELVANCLTTLGGHTHRPRAHETARLMHALAHPFKKRTLHHCEITARNGILTIAREAARVEGPITLSGRGSLLWDQRFRVQYDITNGKTYTLRALGNDGRKQLTTPPTPRTTHPLPLSTPSLWHLDELVFVPYITTTPDAVTITLTFAPAKPLAPTPFW